MEIVLLCVMFNKKYYVYVKLLVAGCDEDKIN